MYTGFTVCQREWKIFLCEKGFWKGKPCEAGRTEVKTSKNNARLQKQVIFFTVKIFFEACRRESFEEGRTAA
jgi:hypothetical protein